jgi:hypothetical protein
MKSCVQPGKIPSETYYMIKATYTDKAMQCTDGLRFQEESTTIG